MDLEIQYWVFAGISLLCWFLVYISQIYSRFKNVNNISFYLTVFWFLSDALVLFCSILIFGTIKSIIVIEVLVFVVFDIFSICQYLFLCKKIDRKKIIFLTSIIFIYIILCICGYYFREIIVPLTWLSIFILVISRLPQILEYYYQNIPNPNLVISILSLTICANASFYVSILTDIHRKNEVGSYIPWLVCKILIIVLDIILIIITLVNKKKQKQRSKREAISEVVDF